MDTTPAWQRAIEYLADDDNALRADLIEIARWFPSGQMLLHHALGLVKVMTDDEKRRAMPAPGIAPVLVLRFAMAETRSDDPRQRARWWMYRSATTPSPHPDPFRVASRMQRVDDVVLALPAPVNTAYWDRFKPDLLVHDDVSDVQPSSEDESYSGDSDSGYKADSESSGEEEIEVVVLSDDEPDDVVMLPPVVAGNEGDRELPIDVDLLPEVPDIVKQEVVEEVLAEVVDGQAREGSKKRKKPTKIQVAGEVRRSQRLKELQK